MNSKQRWHPHVTVATVVKRSDQYLMVEERSELAGPVINQPAGHLEPNESLVEAAIRETLEESCWSIRIEHLVGIYQWSLPPMSKQNQSGKTYLRFTFSGQVIEDRRDQTERDPDIIDTHWLTLDEINNNFVARSPLVLKSILDYEAGRRFPLDAYTNLDSAVA